MYVTILKKQDEQTLWIEYTEIAIFNLICVLLVTRFEKWYV